MTGRPVMVVLVMALILSSAFGCATPRFETLPDAIHSCRLMQPGRTLRRNSLPTTRPGLTNRFGHQPRSIGAKRSSLSVVPTVKFSNVYRNFNLLSSARPHCGLPPRRRESMGERRGGDGYGDDLRGGAEHQPALVHRRELRASTRCTTRSPGTIGI